VEGALQETLIQEEDQRRQQAYFSRGRSDLKGKIREDSRRIPQEEDQRRSAGAGVFLKRKIREDSRRIVFLKRKIREDSGRISQEEDQRRQQAYSSTEEEQ
jgi:hypothetical protein